MPDAGCGCTVWWRLCWRSVSTWVSSTWSHTSRPPTCIPPETGGLTNWWRDCTSRRKGRPSDSSFSISSEIVGCSRSVELSWSGKELLWQYFFFYHKISGSSIANSTNQVVTNIVPIRPQQVTTLQQLGSAHMGSWKSHLGGLQRSHAGHWEPRHYSLANIQGVCHGDGSWI